MILYDKNCIIYMYIYFVGLSLGIFVSCMNRNKDGIPFYGGEFVDVLKACAQVVTFPCEACDVVWVCVYLLV